MACELKLPHDYALPDDEIHLWRTRAEWPPQRIGDLSEWLSSEERERADRFRLAIDRKRHVVGRALLRLLLGRLLGTAPGSLRFSHNAFGKPGLRPDSTQRPLQFNISHAGDIVLVAVAANRAIGIDVERVRRDVDVEAIANGFFSPRERAELAALDSHARHDAFFRCWSRKEAFIKARGEGLSLPLDQFDVSLLPDKPAMLLATRPDAAESSRWVLHDLNVGPGYKAALAIERAGSTRLKAWEFLPDLCSAVVWRDAADV